MEKAVLSPATLKFNSEKSWPTAVALLFPITINLVLFPVVLLDPESNWGQLIVPFLLLIINAQICWMWFHTGYEINDTTLSYYSGLMKGKIEIASIRKIEKKKNLYGGLKPALGVHGLIVHYQKYEDIYISPENQEAFVAALQERNPTIEVGL